MEYNPQSIDKKWQQYWKENETYKVSNISDKPKYYVLDMFPYPSGAGLHVGHPLGYIASDIYSRYKTLKGFNVLHPMGFDAFGLPAEQYAISHGIHPADSTATNINCYKAQLENIGFCFDWSREITTSDPAYYKWTQWIFIQLFEHYYDLTSNKPLPIEQLINEFELNGNQQVNAANSSEASFSAEDWQALSEIQKDAVLMNYRLAYRKTTQVNWCEQLGTVLANDEVKEGLSERGGFPVEKRDMVQWSLRITAYAERLLKDLDTLEWSDALKTMQRNWIGKSEGAELAFSIDGYDEALKIFTTRPDTIYGATFMVLAPEHPFVNDICSKEQVEAIESYRNKTKSKSERDRISTKEVTGVYTGAFAVHPFSGKKIPIWLADYVLMDYGTGAIMAVPSDDSRDRLFAEKFGLEIVPVVDKSKFPNAGVNEKVGTMINSEELNGLSVNEAILKALELVEQKNLGLRTINYKLRDANYSRQRYWGEPFPITYDENGVASAAKLEDLPLELPKLTNFKPASGGKSPLSRIEEWKNLANGDQRETDTMPGFAGSSWYFLRYMDPNNSERFASKKAIEYWQNVDLYIGGTEHSVGHLLYSRFWHKILFDLGYVPTIEPFKKLVNQGMIQGRSNFLYRANEQMVESFVSQKLKEYKFDVEHNYPVAGAFVDFACIEKKLALEIKGSNKLQAHLDHLKPRFEKEGWKIVGISIEEIGKYWNNFDIVIKQINRALDGEELPKIDVNIPAYPVYISKDMVQNEQHVTAIHVDIHYVNDDILDIEQFRKTKPEYKNAMFITNQAGEYHCGALVEKMSKSKYNVINPDEVVDKYGADCFRMYEMFLGPIEQSKPWNTNGIDGVVKFLSRFWSLFFVENDFAVSEETASPAELKVLHAALKKVTSDIERFSFNTCISAFMVCTNELRKLNCHKRVILEPLVVAISPFAPHLAEELWSQLGHENSIHEAHFPEFNEKFLVESEIEYPISINGKKRATASFSADASKEELENAALELEAVKKWTEGKTIRKIIVVPKRMINIVVG